jgi:hypothetical protein
MVRSSPPLRNELITLRPVTGQAGGNQVFDVAVSAARYWDYMVAFEATTMVAAVLTSVSIPLEHEFPEASPFMTGWSAASTERPQHIQRHNDARESREYYSGVH